MATSQTALLDAADAEAWFRLAARAPFGVTIWRADTDRPADVRLIYSNARAAEESGVPMQEMVGRTVGELFPAGLAAPSDQNIPETWLRVASTERVETMEAVPYGDDEHPMGWFRIHFIPLGDRRVASIYENVTRQIAARRELEQFADVASHDLQAPLRTISSFIDLLVEALGPELPERPRSFVRHIRTGVDRMQAHLRGLLAYARAGRRAVAEPVAVVSVLAEVRQALRRALDDADTEFEVGPLPTVRVPRVALQRLLLNLIDNAVKYRAAAPLRIAVSAERYPGGWRFAVRDNGIGVAADDREEAFEMFRRLQPASVAEGAGLGLAICRRTVEMWGGEIALGPAEGQGTEVRFTVPDPADDAVG